MVISKNERHGDGSSSTRKSDRKRKMVIPNNERHEEGVSSMRKRGKKSKMVIDNNARQEEGISSTKSSGKKHCLIWEEEDNIWVNILSRLPLKTLIVCQSVCKSWKRKISHNKKKLKFLPLDGFIIRSSSFGETTKNHFHINYVSLTMKKTIEMQINTPSSLVVGSNYDMDLLDNLCSDFGGLCVENSWKAGSVLDEVSNTTRDQIMSESIPSMPPYHLDTSYNLNSKTSLLANFSFDFGGLYVQNPSHANMFFAIHGGLILVIHEDGTYQVHNPATRKVFVLPKSPVCKAYSDSATEGLLERAGFIIKLQSPFRSVSSYLVVRLCRISKKVEVCRSYSHHKWKVSSFDLDNELMNACWCWENYVVILGARTLCFLTDKDRGVTMEFRNRNDVRVYGFSLPSSVQKGFHCARIGGSRGCLYLSSYCNTDNNADGVWIWKHVDAGRTVTQDAWIPVVEISQARMRQLSCTCTPSELVSKILMEDDDFVIIPMCFHPDIVVIYLRVKSSIFAYDMANDTLEEIGEINEQVFGASTIALPYSPCLASLKPLKVLYNLAI